MDKLSVCAALLVAGASAASCAPYPPQSPPPVAPPPPPVVGQNDPAPPPYSPDYGAVQSPPASGLAEQPPQEYAELDSYGRWFNYGSYGLVWSPANMPADWRPYSYGRWVWSDAGWYFDSEEPFGWATFHYGRWFYDGEYGWLWVPDDQWGPSWVCWREGADWQGWAPAPPGVAFGITAPACNDWDESWLFVSDDDFLLPRVYAYAAPVTYNSWYLQQSRPIGETIAYHEPVGGGTARAARGPEPARVTRGAPLAPRHLEAAAPGSRPGLQGDRVTVARPAVQHAPLPPTRIPPSPPAMRIPAEEQHHQVVAPPTQARGPSSPPPAPQPRGPSPPVPPTPPERQPVVGREPPPAPAPAPAPARPSHLNELPAPRTPPAAHPARVPPPRPHEPPKAAPRPAATPKK